VGYTYSDNAGTTPNPDNFGVWCGRFLGFVVPMRSISEVWGPSPNFFGVWCGSFLGFAGPVQ